MEKQHSRGAHWLALLQPPHHAAPIINKAPEIHIQQATQTVQYTYTVRLNSLNLSSVSLIYVSCSVPLDKVQGAVFTDDATEVMPRIISEGGTSPEGDGAVGGGVSVSHT